MRQRHVCHGNSEEKSSSSPSGLIFSGDSNPLAQRDALDGWLVSDVQPQGQCFENLAKAIGKYDSTVFMLHYEKNKKMNQHFVLKSTYRQECLYAPS
jgi:hypothetical protein